MRKLTITRWSAGLATRSRRRPRSPAARRRSPCCAASCAAAPGISAPRRRREQPLGPEVEDRDHDRERERVAERQRVVRERRVEPDLDRREHEAADDRAAERAQPADDGGDERLQHRGEAHRRLDGSAAGEDEDRRDPGEQAGDREGDGDHAVGRDAHQPRDLEVLARPRASRGPGSSGAGRASARRATRGRSRS